MRLCYSLVMFMALLMLVSGVSLISGCGQKGPLYLPTEAQKQAPKNKSEQDKTKQTKTKQTQQP